MFVGFYLIIIAENKSSKDKKFRCLSYKYFRTVKRWRYGYAHILGRFCLIFAVYIQFKSLFRTKNFCKQYLESEEEQEAFQVNLWIKTLNLIGYHTKYESAFFILKLS